MLQDSSFQPSLADLSRNASVISTSSSDSSLLKSPYVRPLRTFSAPRSKSPPPLSSPSSKNPRSKSRAREPTPDDFKFGPTLGSGSYSEVKLATHTRTGQQYAIKVLEKGHLIRKNKMQTALAERRALAALGPGTPGLSGSITPFKMNFVIDLARNGEMQTLISRMGSLSVACARHYAAQLVDAIEYMHSKGVIHRDLKPENLLLDDNWRIKVTDFGTGKILESGAQKAESWVGTAQYVAPELLEAKETSKSTDFWALGCIIYQMIAGRFAFQGLSEYLTWQKIKRLEYSFPEGFDERAKDLVQRLLVKEPNQRLGVGRPGSGNDTLALRSHPFFSNISWETLWMDSVPRLDPGLLQRIPDKGEGTRWEDVESAWDELVGGDESDGMEWADSGAQSHADKESELSVGLGSFNEIRRQPLVRQDTESTIQPSTSPIGQHLVLPQPHLSPLHQSLVRESLSSSSEGSPDSKVNQRSEPPSLPLPQSGPLPPSAQPEEDDRGRNKALSPVQGNGLPNDTNFARLLNLPQNEQIIFNSIVEALPLRRRASRLIPLPVPPGKPKTRQLLLTNRRLFCLKQHYNNKRQDGITIKLELAFRASEKLKDKDSRATLVSVEQKTEREFVVLTNTKSFSYAAKDAELASTWTRKINEALETCNRQGIEIRT